MTERHPGGRTCRKAMPLAIVLTIVTMAKRWREIPALWRDTR